MEVELEKGYYTHGKITNKEHEKHKYRIIKIYPNEISYMKDLVLCEEVLYGYKECFHRMDLGGLINENRNTNE